MLLPAAGYLPQIAMCGPVKVHCSFFVCLFVCMIDFFFFRAFQNLLMTLQHTFSNF